MTDSSPAVTRSTHAIPVSLHIGLDHLRRLADAGTLEEVAERLQIPRQGGYSGVHLFVVLVLFLTSRSSGGIQSFVEQNSAHLRAIALVLGYESLPSGAAVSRLLKAVPERALHDFLRWLLQMPPGFRSLLSNPCMLTLDAVGTGWHVFDFDPTADTVYRRMLKRAGPRRSASLAKPAYAGRKRGDATFRRSSLHHAGSGFWLDCVLEAGHGDTQRAFADSVSLARTVIPQGERVLIRADGEFGGVRYHGLCEAAGADFLTRLCRYNLLDQEDVRARLRTVSWYPVRSSTGLPRFAADLGRVLLHASDRTVGPDGEALAPVEVRVIVVRSATGDIAGRGIKVESEQVELFATSLDPVAWPAAAVVELYQARSTVENRFAQEDREFRLDRIFSYSAPGQELATGIGLFLWNLEIAIGVTVAPLPATRPVQQRAIHEVAVVPPLFPAANEALPAVTHAPEPTTKPTEPPVAKPVPADEHAALVEALESAIDQANWRTLPHGWARERGDLQIRCPEGKRLKVFYVEAAKPPAERGSGQNRVGYRTDVGVCDGCPLRERCTSNTRPNTYKFFSKNLPFNAACSAKEWLTKLGDAMPQARPTRRPKRNPQLRAPVPAASRSVLNLDETMAPGPWAWEGPTFRPRQARIEARKLWVDQSVTVIIDETEALALRPHPLVHPPGHRSMPARLDSKQRLARYACKAGTSAKLDVRPAPFWPGRRHFRIEPVEIVP